MTDISLPRGGKPSAIGAVAMELTALRQSKREQERQMSAMRRENIELKCMIIELQSKLKMAKARKPDFNLKNVKRKRKEAKA